jgi:hypothetical protein
MGKFFLEVKVEVVRNLTFSGSACSRKKSFWFVPIYSIPLNGGSEIFICGE